MSNDFLQVGSHFQALFIRCATHTVHVHIYVCIRIWHMHSAVYCCVCGSAKVVQLTYKMPRRVANIWTHQRDTRSFGKTCNQPLITSSLYCAIIYVWQQSNQQTTANSVMDRTAQVKQTKESSYQHFNRYTCMYTRTHQIQIYSHTSTSENPNYIVHYLSLSLSPSSLSP